MKCCSVPLQYILSPQLTENTPPPPTQNKYCLGPDISNDIKPTTHIEGNLKFAKCNNKRCGTCPLIVECSEVVLKKTQTI